MDYRKLFFLFAGAVALLAVALIGTGISVIEGPATMKLKNADKRRIRDFNSIDQAITQLHKTTDRMPTTLDELVGSTSRRLNLKDPETGAAYEYTVLADRIAEICAEFNLSNVSSNDSIYTSGVWAWQYGAEKNCYKIEVEAKKN